MFLKKNLPVIIQNKYTSNHFEGKLNVHQIKSTILYYSQ